MGEHLQRGLKDTPQVKIFAGALDVDGTLVAEGSSAMPSQRVLTAMQAASALIPLSIVTARPLGSAKYLLETNFFQGLSILSNGAQIYDGANHQMLVERVLDHDITRALLQGLQEAGIMHWVQDDGTDYVWDEKEYIATDTRQRGYSPQKPFIIVAHRVHASHIDAVHAMVAQYARAQIGSSVAHEHPDGTFDIFISDTRANKLSALQEVAGRLGLSPKNILFVGNGHNDVGVLDAATGVAVENAVGPAKDVATFITSDQEHDGVAIALEELVLGR